VIVVTAAGGLTGSAVVRAPRSLADHLADLDLGQLGIGAPDPGDLGLPDRTPT
jgi:hypothetical protein